MLELMRPSGEGWTKTRCVDMVIGAAEEWRHAAMGVLVMTGCSAFPGGTPVCHHISVWGLSGDNYVSPTAEQMAFASLALGIKDDDRVVEDEKMPEHMKEGRHFLVYPKSRSKANRALEMIPEEIRAQAGTVIEASPTSVALTDFEHGFMMGQAKPMKGGTTLEFGYDEEKKKLLCHIVWPHGAEDWFSADGSTSSKAKEAIDNVIDSLVKIGVLSEDIAAQHKASALAAVTGRYFASAKN